jgi:hypothetical protein
MMQLVLYSKPGCHLCEGLEEKLKQITEIAFNLEIRDINNNADWFSAYQYEIPVLCVITPQGEKQLPRLSPRASVAQVQKQLQQILL